MYGTPNVLLFICQIIKLNLKTKDATGLLCCWKTGDAKEKRQ